MQALIERAYHLGTLDKQECSAFYKQMSRRGWRRNEPGSDDVAPETPRLASSIGTELNDSGLTDQEIRSLVGVDQSGTSPFLVSRSRGGLRLVSASA